MEIKDYQWHQGASGHFFATVHTVHSSAAHGAGASLLGNFGHMDLSPLWRVPMAWAIFCLFCMFAAWVITRK